MVKIGDFTCNSKLTLELMITERNKEKRQGYMGPCLALLKLNMDLSLNFNPGV